MEFANTREKFDEMVELLGYETVAKLREEKQARDIQLIKEREEKQKAEEQRKLNAKLQRKGITLEEYKRQEEEKRLKAKKKRYIKELEELNKRKEYLERWLKEN